MERLGAEDLLALWEQGTPLHPIDRVLAVLARAMPDRDLGELARMPLGERDGLLLRARAEVLGDRLEAHDSCPACGEHVEVELSCDELAGPETDRVPGRWSLELEGFRLTLRTLDSLDAAAAARCEDADSARSALLRRVVEKAASSGTDVDVGSLPDDVVSAIGRSLAAHDERAELMLELRCPACGTEWQNLVDVASFVWTELSDRAGTLLQDVDALARAYGWREPDILALSDERRAAYLALAAP